MMAEYFFPAFIFITSLFIFWILIKPSERLLGIVCFLGSGLITYIISEVAKNSSGNSILIFAVCFSLELILLVLLVIFDKKEVNVKVISIIYSIAILISFLSARGCYKSDKEDEIRKVEAGNEIAEFKMQYDFDVDSLLPNQAQNTSSGKVKLKFPIIVYHKWNDTADFDYEFNKSLERSLTSFSYDSINTIIVLENSYLDVGTYGNGRTTAHKTQTTISFIDKQTNNLIKTITLTGGNPPSSIEYHSSPPLSASGSRPTNDEIIETIKKELQ